jgi:uncharacterized protein
MLIKNDPLGKKGRYFCQFGLGILLTLNILSYICAYVLTHFSLPGHLGLGASRPTNTRLPTDIGLQYLTQRISINQTEWLETWFIPTQTSKSYGTVLLFPGNAGSKSKQLLAPAQVFHNLGYNTLLVDFRGVGGSSGNTTTLGIREAKDVALTLKTAQRSNLKRPFILYGVSMGTAAILKAVADQTVKPDAIILELPYTRLLDAVRSRVKIFRIPTFPIAELVVFWGGVQHGINGFTHNPITYANQVKCPTLILYGKLDKWTTEAEVNQMVQNLQGPKQLVIFPNSGHDLLVTTNKDLWQKSIGQFLEGI